MRGKVFFLTGAAGTGKTTAARVLAAHVRPIKRVNFGQVLLDYKRRQRQTRLSYRRLRTQSAAVLSHGDVAAMDDWFADRVNAWRARTNVIIDSHPVTKESFGFRATAYSLDQLKKIAFDAVIVLHCEPAELVRRVKADPRGRRIVTVHEAAQHEYLQESVALTYGIVCACPCFILDNTKTEKEELLKRLLDVLRSVGTVFTLRRRMRR